ncbi:hypothetical protein [Halodesulfovibrio sp. MK-HDV]|jgi:hypothetical protein|uniref:hypothetical protein n=1 Tax=Halodesulfovibrio sp. MK-HDV TaxID=2599925 RepID=UPI0013716984|nr:hypothetical protein [Halodesulfovibrio sp. MK-HDV]KAF1076269.1 hypothetical protein MKHDV_01290 [Halodesulfovibrio sp. MK-HDV]
MIDKLLPIFETNPQLSIISRNVVFVSFTIIVIHTSSTILQQPLLSLLDSELIKTLLCIVPSLVLGFLFFILAFLTIHFFGSYFISVCELEEESANAIKKEFPKIDEIERLEQEYALEKQNFDSENLRVDDQLNLAKEEPSKDELDEINSNLSSLEVQLKRYTEIKRKLACEKKLLEYHRKFTRYSRLRFIVSFCITSIVISIAISVSLPNAWNIFLYYSGAKQIVVLSTLNVPLPIPS